MDKKTMLIYNFALKDSFKKRWLTWEFHLRSLAQVVQSVRPNDPVTSGLGRENGTWRGLKATVLWEGLGLKVPTWTDLLKTFTQFRFDLMHNGQLDHWYLNDYYMDGIF